MEIVNLHIKNMVCPRCELVLVNELKSMGAEIMHSELGFVQTKIPNDITVESIGKKLNEFGFELLGNKENQTVERIKIEILKYINLLESDFFEVKLSTFLVEKIGKNYSFLSRLFSNHENQTIESFYIIKKIKRVKELISYKEQSLSEIAIQLGYSSVHYLSNQFKKINGKSVSDYKKELKIG